MPDPSITSSWSIVTDPYVPSLGHPPGQNVGGIGGSTALGSNDVIYESSDPTSEGLTPPDSTKPSQAYKRDGTGDTFGWDPISQTWT